MAPGPMNVSLQIEVSVKFERFSIQFETEFLLKFSVKIKTLLPKKK